MKVKLLNEIPGYPKGTIFDSQKDLNDNVLHHYVIAELVKEGWAEPILEGRINSKHWRKYMNWKIILACILIYLGGVSMGMFINKQLTKDCEKYYVCAPEDLCCGVRAGN